MKQGKSAGQACVCVFAKAPQPGVVKTRLLAVLSPKQACTVHEGLVSSCLAAIDSPDWQTQLWSTDPENNFIRQCRQAQRLSHHLQWGSNLGERMANAVHENLQRHEQVIIVGTDCPQIDHEMINTAINHLRSGKDIVLAPADDGGYVLIGFSTQVGAGVLEVFNNIDWGTEFVLEQTRARIRSSGLDSFELVTCRDIDRPPDLYWLADAYPELFHSIGVSVALPQSDHEPG